jgi:hypothetical protein
LALPYAACAAVLSAWPNLPESVKAGILATFKTIRQR